MTHQDDLARLDDMLHHDDTPRHSASQRADAWVVKSLVYSIMISAAAWAIAYLAGWSLPFVLLVIVCMALFSLRRLLRSFQPDDLDETLPSSVRDYAEADYRWPMADGVFTAVGRWDSRLGWTRDAEQFNTAILPRLGELVDERLRQHHGVTRRSDPARARALLGDPLWTFLATPVTRPPTPRQLAVVVKQLEDL